MSLPSLSLNGQVAVITGARQGIGKHIALTFAEAGADIAIGDKVVDDGKLASVAKEIQNLGRRAMADQSDVSLKAENDKLIQKVMKEFGRIDILVNNAAVGNTQPIHEQDEATWDKEMDTDLKGPQFLSSAAAKIMTNQKKGNIINIASVAGLIHGYGNAYAVAKAGLIRMTRIYAFFLGKHNVRVNCIAPGLIDTEILLNMPPEQRKDLLAGVPLGRIGQTSDIASVALFLASDASSFVTGVTIPVDGGMVA